MDNKDVSPFADVDPLLYSKLLEYPTIRLIQSSRKVWGYDEFLEIKHVCSEVLNIKTRGQVGHYEYEGHKYPTVLAKAGHKIDGDKKVQALQMKEWFYEENITYNEVSTLASLRDIFDEKKLVNDLISVKSKVKVNTDYDYKRMPLSSGNSDTMAFKSIHEVKKYRSCAKNIRAEGEKSTAYNVQNAVKLSTNNIKKSGGSRVFVIRHFIRALVQGALPINLDEISYSDISIRLERFGVSVSKLKDAKRSTFVQNVVLDTPQNRSLIKNLLKEFGKQDIYRQVLDILLDRFVRYV